MFIQQARVNGRWTQPREQNVCCFLISAIGNPRGHENPFLLAFGILWFRWHNYEASRVLRQNPTWDLVEDDEKIFNIARKRVTALYQVNESRHDKTCLR